MIQDPLAVALVVTALGLLAAAVAIVAYCVCAAEDDPEEPREPAHSPVDALEEMGDEVERVEFPFQRAGGGWLV